MTRLTLLSDTHAAHHLLPPLPAGDILIHAGDGGDSRTEDYVESLLTYLARQPVPDVLYGPGNHDFPFMQDATRVRQLAGEIGGGRIHILEDAGVTLRGLNFWGMPWNLSGRAWAFNADEDLIARRCRMIPDDAHVLITHSPPLGTFDLAARGKRIGSAALRARLRALPELKLHVFGHCHEHGGSVYAGPRYVSVNAALWDGREQRMGRPTHLVLP